MTCVLAIPLLGIYPREMKSVCQRDTYTSMFIVALFTLTYETSQVSIKRILKEVEDTVLNETN